MKKVQCGLSCANMDVLYVSECLNNVCVCVYLLCAHKDLCVHFRKRLRRHWSVSIYSMYTSKCLYGRTNHCTADVPAAESTPLWATCCHHYLERALVQPLALNMGWKTLCLMGSFNFTIGCPSSVRSPWSVHKYTNDCVYVRRLCISLNVCFLWLSLMLFLDRYWAKLRHLVSKPINSCTLVHK